MKRKVSEKKAYLSIDEYEKKMERNTRIHTRICLVGAILFTVLALLK